MLARRIAITMALSLLAAAPAAAQESPEALTPQEWKCEKETARGAARFGASTTDCVLECEKAAETDPLRFCGPFGFDTTTQLCLDRARTSPQIRGLRKCSAERCPECYFGGDCRSYGDFVLDWARRNSAQRAEVILCDDRASPDGLNPDEGRCRERMLDWSDRLSGQLSKCFLDCQDRRQAGRTTDEACEPFNLDTPQADEKLQSCVLNARIRFLRSCIRCDDTPECWATTSPPVTCSDLLGTIEATAASDENRHFCVDVPFCGDGFISPPEECDFGPVDGCGANQFCDGDCTCTDFPVCGDGQITAFEECDASATPTGCEAGHECIGCSFCQKDPCAVVTAVGPEGGVFHGATSGSNGINGSCGGSGPEDTYSFTPAQSGFARVETCGSSFDTVLHVRRGACGFDGFEVACNNDSCGQASRVVFPVQAGETYYIYVDGRFFGVQGSYRLQVTPPGGLYGSPDRAFLHDPNACLFE